jgi:pyruvate carboxylase subunit B
MEYAMHPKQYEDFKSGKAKERFLEDLDNRRSKTSSKASFPAPAPNTDNNYQPKVLHLDINGESYKVSVSYDEEDTKNADPKKENGSSSNPPITTNGSKGNGQYEAITAPLEGKFFLTKESSDIPIKVGDTIEEGDTIAYIEAMKVINAITADKSGKVLEIVARHGEEVEEDDVIIKIQ